MPGINQIKIEGITLLDRQAVIDLHRHIRSTTDLPIYPEYTQANIDFGIYEKGWAQYFTNKEKPDAKDWAVKASLDNKMIGFSRVSAIDPPDDEKLQAIAKDGWAELHWLYVLPEYQGQGLGKRLYYLTTKQIADWGCHQMLVEAYRDNPPTRKFYEKLGLRFSHEILSHNLRNGHQFDIPSVRYVELNLR